MGRKVKQYELIRRVRDSKVYRDSFMELAKEIFGLSFWAWYENGFWTDRYIPYALADGGRVVANASANIIDTVWRGEIKRYIQIGTVMTHPDYRNRGLMKAILEALIADWKDACNGIYLYANDSVLEFYPKFGFETAQEYGYSIKPDVERTGERVEAAGEAAQDGSKILSVWEKLDMSGQKARRLLRDFYRRSNPYSALPMLNNDGLLMFYCADFMKESVYYSRKLDAVCVASREGRAVCLADVFGSPGCSLHELAADLPFEGYDTVVLGFTPKRTEGCICLPLREEDTTLFVYRDKENIFGGAKVRMPELSRA